MNRLRKSGWFYRNERKNVPSKGHMILLGLCTGLKPRISEKFAARLKPSPSYRDLFRTL
jgi:hypothetical protein